MLPSGKRLHNYGKIHHAINGKQNYFDWAIFYVAKLLEITLMFNGKIPYFYGHVPYKSPFSHGFPMVYVGFTRPVRQAPAHHSPSPSAWRAPAGMAGIVPNGDPKRV